MEITVENVLGALKYVEDPDLKKDLVTLNMIKDVKVDGKNVSFTATVFDESILLELIWYIT